MNNNNFVSIGDLLHLCAAKWHWFVISVVLCLAVAVFRVSHAVQTFTSDASIMVLDEKEGKSSRNSVGEEFSNMGLVSQSSNVSNVIKQMTSLNVLMEVARGLDTTADEEQVLGKAIYIRKRLSVEKADKQSTVINLTYTDYSAERAIRTLALVIQSYNDKWMEDKLLATKKTTVFIDSRLALLKSELDSLDEGISTFKSDNRITDLKRVGDIYLQQRSQSDAEIMRMTNQRSVARYIRNLLNDESAHELLPVNSGLNNPLIESQISTYNEHVLQYNSHLDYTSAQNPRIIIQEKELGTLRGNIQKALDNYIKSLSIQIVSLENYNNKAVHNITSNPVQAKYLATIEREQKVKEGLYLYLLQKKEENEISSSYQINNIKTLDDPYESGGSSSKKTKALAAAFLLGILLPALVIFLQSMTDKTVRKRADIERYSNLSLMGMVPEYDRKSPFARCTELLSKIGVLHKIRLLQKIGLWHKTGLLHRSELVVQDGKQDAVNEAFRLLRTKLLQNTDNKVYMTTSYGQGDGKTFVSTNLALALAVSRQHILFIDGDLRQGTASRLWQADGPGLADYLNGSRTDVSSLLFHPDDYPTLDILPSGNLPSNPTELLASREFGELIVAQRLNYDIVLIDTPKIENLADAEIIAEQSDATLFVIRVGKTNRQYLDELVTAQENGIHIHLGLIMNYANEQ